MSLLASHRRHGVIPRASGAAAAALKARASAWEAPLTETPGVLSLFVWGCELRLTAETDSARIELLAPEARLIGTLQDSATEIFAEAGLEVAWDRVDEGALAPGLSVMRVAAVIRRSPGFLRIRLQGPEAARFGETSLHFRLLLPPPGRAAVWPRVAASGRTSWPEGADALHRPVYTVAAQQGDCLEFDIFRHAGSPTCDWAMSGVEGSQVAIIGPGGGWCPEGPALSLFGDQTALPAIARMLDLAPHLVSGPVRAWIRAAPEDLGALADDPRLTRTDDLLGALAAANLPQGHVWLAGHAPEARAARQHLLARGWPRRDFTAAAYWD
ncbi:siderophore-interacting protein (plasmid) [Paracoccus liaowanqingii]|uniref:Siderophore-interacting protein n=1 Tax=Paracoccus liaowanqingii TaxID=2560053 RepID=A0A4Y5SSW5_9RHOB|nr:siderophore-interacting protein [Paracoccus liaowanqingii]QDA36581.1 siderophore-interacting protein [Paracoccus liaowanqingii]